MKGLSVLALVSVAGWACQRESTAAAPLMEAFVGFPTVVDTAVLRSAGVTLVEARASPPAARIKADDAALRVIEASPGVSYVVVLNYIEPGDSAGVFLGLRDRPTVADSLSDADRQLIASVGGRVVFVYTSLPVLAAMVPAWAVPTLKTSPYVTSLEIEGPPASPV